MSAPRFARLLLWLCTPRDSRDDVLGDLEETYRRRASASSARAWVASMYDAVVIAAAMCWQRVSQVAAVPRRMTIRGLDARLAARLMWRQPLLTLTATTALAVGIALAMVGFAFMEALLFSRLPFPGGDRFVFIEVVEDGRRTDGIRLSPEDYQAIATQATALEHLGALTAGRRNVVTPDGAVAVATIAGLTPSTWRFVPHAMVDGRPFSSITDGSAGAMPAALVRASFSRALFSAERRAVGAALSIAGVDHTIVGVVPDEMKFPNTPDVWVAIDEAFLEGRGTPGAGSRLLGILAPGQSLEALQAQLTGIAASRKPGDDAWRLSATMFTDLGPIGRMLSLAAVTVVMAVLLVIAANVGNLILARSFARSREFALRAALGASRGQLVMQVFLEVLVLAGVAALLGGVSASALLRTFNALDELPYWIDFTAGPRTVGLVIGAAVLAAAVAGVWPALRATRPDLAPRLGDGGRTGELRFGRLAGFMVISQIAVSIVMLHGALVVAQGFRQFATDSLDLPRNVLTTYLSADAVQGDADGVRTAPLSTTEVERLVAEIPGVRAAGLATALPRHSPPALPVEVESTAGRPGGSPAPAPAVEVSQGFFAALDARLLRGRVLTAADYLEGARPVAVVDEPFARRFFGEASAIGQRFRAVRPEGPGAWTEIVGVVPDLGLNVADKTLAAGYYVPLASDARSVYLAIRTAGDPMTLVDPVRRALVARDPSFVFNRFQRLEDEAQEDRQFFKWFSLALLGLGGMTLILALAGVYAMMSLIVSRRTREIGVRMALGATTTGIVRAILGRVALQVAIGGALGAILALISLDARAVLVSRLGDGGPWTLPAVLALLVLAGLAATWFPLRRALGVEASEALRAE